MTGARLISNMDNSVMIKIETDRINKSIILPISFELKQLLRALIDNSVKYTQNGGTIHLSFGSEGENAVLSVSDDGIGMDAEHCEHIFERFYRVDPARTRATGGMGLGLSIVSVIAQAHCGYVTAESKPGFGTTVTVIFPN